MSRVMISVADDFLAEIDQAAANEHRSRSELFREAMRQYLNTGVRTPESAAQAAAGVIERLRERARARAMSANDSTETLRALRGYADNGEN